MKGHQINQLPSSSLQCNHVFFSHDVLTYDANLVVKTVATTVVVPYGIANSEFE